MAIAPIEAVPDGKYPLRAITVAQYARTIETGIFEDGERVELLDSRLIVSPPAGPLHAELVRWLIAFFARRRIDRGIFDSNGALTLGLGSCSRNPISCWSRRPATCSIGTWNRGRVARRRGRCNLLAAGPRREVARTLARA